MVKDVDVGAGRSDLALPRSGSFPTGRLVLSDRAWQVEPHHEGALRRGGVGGGIAACTVLEGSPGIRCRSDHRLPEWLTKSEPDVKQRMFGFWEGWEEVRE